MNTLALPDKIDNLQSDSWQTFAPYFEALQQREIGTNSAEIHQWLEQYSHLSKLIHEAGSLIYINTTLDTNDKEVEETYMRFVSDVRPQAQSADQQLKQRLLSLDEAETGLALAMRSIRNQVAMFREENLPLFTAIAKLNTEYDKLTGNLSAEWNGEQQNLNQLVAHVGSDDRAEAERAYRTILDLWLSIRQPLNDLFVKLLPFRQKVAENAGFPDYRAYAFRRMERFEYTPEDCFTFHEAIEVVVVPAVERLLRKKQARLGVDRLMPWDWVPDMGNIVVSTIDGPPLKPYRGQDELIAGCSSMFHQLDSELALYFDTMAADGLLDLDTRQGKAMGGYCSTLPLRERAFIFMNGVGTHDNVQTMLHEAGHAFHAFESMAHTDLYWQRNTPMEFCEVASMAMELLAAPNLVRERGGFYSAEEAARARIEHLESILLFLPYMSVVDRFQHWVYTHPDEAMDTKKLDAHWLALWQRCIPLVDWSQFRDSAETGWQRKLHIFQVPFYYIEYGMAQIGAMQVWRNSLEDYDKALADYRYALSLGGTRTLPALFEAAGAEFRFDVPMLTELVALVEATIADLEQQL